MKRFFAANGYDFEQVVEAAREFRQFVPLVENMAGSTFTLEAPGGSGSFVNLTTGEEIPAVDERGVMIFSNYLHAYEQSSASLERAVAAASWGDLLPALTHGVASVEAYINEQARRWNEQRPDQPLLDSKQSKVSFDDKLDRWIPLMTGGKKLDKGDARWAHFKELRAIRDSAAIHIKAPVSGVSFPEMARLINMARTGIAGLLVHLHELFADPVPARIVRGAYAPDVEVGAP